MAPVVRLLESRVVDQIAAGEVVERPAAVVKELVENALDAGAKAIDVVLKDGGRSLIRVADDGHGMDRQDALLAIERHATSKIQQVEDLQGIETLGFRGEALPSIAAVSRFELVTRTAEGEGTRIRVDAGTLEDVREVGAAKGTVIDVRSLFHTLPARKAFLRSAATELSHCVEALIRLALARPEVAFTLRHEDRVMIRSAATGDLRVRAADLLGQEASRLVPIDQSSPNGLRLVGLGAAPGVHRGSAGTALYLYVDGRWVRDTVLRRAVTHAYRELVPEGRHPLVVLDLRVPAGAADVNVHPTKAEVRFRDPSGVAAFVGEKLRELARTEIRRPDLAASLPFRSALSAPPLAPPPVSALPPEMLLASPPPVPAAPKVPALPPEGLPPAAPAVPALPPEGGAPAAAPPPALPPKAPPSAAPEVPALPGEGLLARESAAPEPPLRPPPARSAPPARPLAVARGRFLVFDDGEGISVIDGGRLSRRVAAAGDLGEARRLMVPCRVRVDRAEALEAREDALLALGLSFVRFSANEVVVRTVPDALSDADPGELLWLALEATGGDVRRAWAEGLSPAEALPDDLLERAAALGIPPGPMVGRIGLPGRP